MVNGPTESLTTRRRFDMENRAYAFITGLFMITLVSAAIAAWVWLSNRHVEHRPYVVVSQDAVSGLNAQTAVFFRGVPAGSVEAIRFDRTDLRNILIDIQLDLDLPITHGTYATLRLQGLTGISQIELHDRGDNPERLASSADNPGRIPMQPSFVDELTDSTRELMRNLNRLTMELTMLLNDNNKSHIQNILAYAQIALEKLVILERNTNDALTSLGPVIAGAGGTLKRIDKLVTDLEGFPAALTRLANNANQLTIIGQSAADQLDRVTLPKTNATLDRLTRTTEDLQDFTRILRQDPQSLLMGRRRPAPGPGEVGYKASRQ